MGLNYSLQSSRILLMAGIQYFVAHLSVFFFCFFFIYIFCLICTVMILCNQHIILLYRNKSISHLTAQFVKRYWNIECYVYYISRHLHATCIKGIYNPHLIIIFIQQLIMKIFFCCCYSPSMKLAIKVSPTVYLPTLNYGYNLIEIIAKGINSYV